LGERAPQVGSKWSWSEYRVVLPVYQDENAVGTIALRASLENYYLEVFRFAGGLAGISGLAIGFASYATGRLRRRLAEKEAARRHAEAELAQSRDQLRRMMGHREHLLEEEHKRIAVEIHDQLGQVLTAAMLNLRSLERGLGSLDDEAKRQFAEVLALLNESYYGMKNIATLLYPAALKFGFAPAVEWLAGRLLKHAGLHWRVETDPDFPTIDQERSMALFRIVQEALVNVVRHAGAKNVRIGLQCERDAVTVEIEDDGSGFDAKAQPVGFGLIGMRERAEFLTGHVTITSRPGEGTCVRVTVPHSAPQKPDA
jgi:signal transduction histidine kinase